MAQAGEIPLSSSPNCPVGILVDIEYSPPEREHCVTPFEDEFCHLAKIKLMKLKEEAQILSTSQSGEEFNILNEKFDFQWNFSTDGSQNIDENNENKNACLDITKIIMKEHLPTGRKDADALLNSLLLNPDELQHIYEEANKVAAEIEKYVASNFFNDDESLDLFSQELPAELNLVENSFKPDTELHSSTFTLNDTAELSLTDHDRDMIITSTPDLDKQFKSNHERIEINEEIKILNVTKTLEEAPLEISSEKTVNNRTMTKTVEESLETSVFSSNSSGSSQYIQKSDFTSSASSISSTTSSIDLFVKGGNTSKKLKTNISSLLKAIPIQRSGARPKTSVQNQTSMPPPKRPVSQNKQPSKMPVSLTRSQSLTKRELPKRVTSGSTSIVRRPTFTKSSQNNLGVSNKENPKTKPAQEKTSQLPLMLNQRVEILSKAPLCETTNKTPEPLADPGTKDVSKKPQLKQTPKKSKIATKIARPRLFTGKDVPSKGIKNPK